MIFTLLCIKYTPLICKRAVHSNYCKVHQEEIMTQFIHYFAILFIVFVCAEIRNVLVYETPHESEPISIWSEASEKQQAKEFPPLKLQ